MREVSDVIRYIGFSHEIMLQHDNRPVLYFTLVIICHLWQCNWTQGAGTSSAVDTYSAGLKLPTFMEPEGVLPGSQDPGIRPYLSHFSSANTYT